MQMNRPTITAHSGCEGTRDGSMAAILRGIELGANLVEVDVRRVPGLGLALTHDVPDDPAGLVTLREAFRAIAAHPGMGINCDLKEYGLAREVMALSCECALAEGQLCFSGSLRPSDLYDDPGILKGARVYLNIEEALSELYLTKGEHAGDLPSGMSPWAVVMERMADEIDQWMGPLIVMLRNRLGGVHALNMPPRPFVRPFMPLIGSTGVRLSLWTINDEADMRELMALPYVDNLTTRQVALAMGVRATLST